MLFINTRGSLLMTAAKKEQYAVADQLKGGLFTHNLFKTMADYLNQANTKPSWKEIFDLTRKGTIADAVEYDCKGKGCIQEPIYSIQDSKGVVINKIL
jgi:hypothetical protein